MLLKNILYLDAKRKTSSPEVVEIFSSDDEEKNAEMGAPKADRNRFESSSSDFSKNGNVLFLVVKEGSSNFYNILPTLFEKL